MKTRIYKSLLWAAILMLGFTACDDGILDTDMYNGKLPAVNFAAEKISIDETTATSTTINLSVYGGPVAENGKIRIKVTPSVGVVYGTDFTTQPAVVDGYIDIQIAKGSESATISMAVVNDLASTSDKTVTFNLCDGQGGIQAGGKYNCIITIINKNSTASWLTITPSVSALADFGSVDKDEESSAKSFNLVCKGLRDAVTVSAPNFFKLSLEENGTYTNALYIEKDEFTNNTPVVIWVKFMPTSGLDGTKEGQVSIKTEGTSGFFVNVSGKETGNSGPYTFVLAPKADGFWNNSKGNVGNKAAMDLKVKDILGDLYYQFDLSAFKKPVSELGNIKFLVRAKTESVGCKISFYQLEPWAAQQTVRPERGEAIISLTDVPVDFGADAWSEIDVTAYVKSMLSSGNKVFYFGIMMTDGTNVQLYGANSNSDFTNNARLIIYDRE